MSGQKATSHLLHNLHLVDRQIDAERPVNLHFLDKLVEIFGLPLLFEDFHIQSLP